MSNWMDITNQNHEHECGTSRRLRVILKDKDAEIKRLRERLFKKAVGHPEHHPTAKDYDALAARLAEREAEIAKNGRHAMRVTVSQLEARLAEAEALLRVMPGYGLSAYDKGRWEKARNALLAADRMLDLTPVGPGETVDDALSRQKSPIWEREPPHCPTCDCGADEVSHKHSCQIWNGLNATNGKGQVCTCGATDSAEVLPHE